MAIGRSLFKNVYLFIRGFYFRNDPRFFFKSACIGSLSQSRNRRKVIYILVAGTQDEVFYTTALYIAPIMAVTGVVGAIPFISCLFAPVSIALAIYSAYLGYLASRSSMNIDQNKAIISVVVAVLATWFVTAVLIGFVVAAIFGGAVLSGGLSS